MSKTADRKVIIDWLNKGRAREMTAVLTYRAQHYALDDAYLATLTGE